MFKIALMDTEVTTCPSTPCGETTCCAGTSTNTSDDIPVASNDASTTPDGDRATRLSRGFGQKQALQAVRAYYSPQSSNLFRSKSDAAAAFGISPQLFYNYEQEMHNSGAVSLILEGRIESPNMPDNFESSAEHTWPSPSELDNIKSSLQGKCTRLGDDVKYGSHGTVGLYREGIKWAVEAMHAKKLPRDGRRASKVLASMGISVSKSSLHSKLLKHQESAATVNTICSPLRSGPATAIPRRYELQLVQYVQTLRALKLKAGKTLLVGAANYLIRDTDIADRFKHREVRQGWYYAFRRRWGIKVKNQTRLEMDRARWTTSSHMRDWYQVVADGLVKCGIAVMNPEFDPEKPYDVVCTITDPDMIFEWDQTGFTLDQLDDGHASTEKTMVVDAEDDGECVANKTNIRWTLTGGSFLNGESLPGCATPPSKSIKLALLKDPPLSTLVDSATGRRRPCQFYPHPSGGFSYELAPLWLKEVVGPCLPKKDGKRAYGLCDGYGAHTTIPMVEAADEIGCDLQLRVPHTSHVSQVADVANFPRFKREAKQAKSDLLVSKVMSGQPPRLTADDMIKVIKEPWERAFHPDISRKGWKEIGFDPASKTINRKLYWDLKAAEEKAANNLERAGASSATLDARCLQFQQTSPGSSSASTTPPPEHGNNDSDSSDSGDSDGADFDSMRLGGEDFRLGPLTYGAGREKLEQRHKRKVEQETLRKERAAKRAHKEQEQAEQRQVVVMEAAEILWKWREHGVKTAMGKLQKKHLSSLLMLTSTPGIKGNETNAILLAALEKKLFPQADQTTPEDALRHLTSLVALFIKV